MWISLFLNDRLFDHYMVSCLLLLATLQTTGNKLDQSNQYTEVFSCSDWINCKNLSLFLQWDKFFEGYVIARRRSLAGSSPSVLKQVTIYLQVGRLDDLYWVAGWMFLYLFWSINSLHKSDFSWFCTLSRVEAFLQVQDMFISFSCSSGLLK